MNEYDMRHLLPGERVLGKGGVAGTVKSNGRYGCDIYWHDVCEVRYCAFGLAPYLTKLVEIQIDHMVNKNYHPMLRTNGGQPPMH